MPTDQEVTRWADEIKITSGLIGGRFSRRDLRARSEHYLRGLISRADRKNNWQLAEEVGEQTPANLQHFIARSRWSADEVRDDPRQYLVEHLGAKDAILVVDETGFLKKGTKPVGVKRQYSGTAGRTGNCQVGVFLAYCSNTGHALIDRSLYLPKEWAQDRSRRIEARIPGSVTFATKPQLARLMPERTLDAGIPAKWITADEVYGSDYRFRQFCEDRGLGYVVAISSQARLFLNGRRTRVDEHVGQIPKRAWRRLSCGSGLKGERLYDWAFVAWPHYDNPNLSRGFLVRRSLSDPNGVKRGLGYVVAISSQARLFLNGRRTRVDEHVGQIPKRAWRRLSCGSGLKGERLYDWAFVAWPHYDNPNLSRGFLVRRSLSDPNDVAYFFTSAPKRTTLKTIVRIAASRWAIEECFEQAKQETGLDEYEVRSWIGWHRHITLSMLAHATLAVIRSRARGG